jgi:ribosome-associated toxin RatA of RatAB toxin-antitoxin module
MTSLRQQALIPAPLESVWELVGDPRRYPEWWPRVIDVKGEKFEEGDEYVQVTREPVGTSETSFLLEHVDDLRAIHMRCQETGTYARWQLAPAQGSTFADVEFGMDPTSAKFKVVDAVIGRIFFRRWLEESIEALKQAATSSGEAPRVQTGADSPAAGEPSPGS